MYVCGWGEEKRKPEGVNGWWEKRNKKEKKNWGVGYTCVLGKKGERKKKEEEKKLKGKKLNCFYLYVHFIWCKV